MAKKIDNEGSAKSVGGGRVEQSAPKATYKAPGHVSQTHSGLAEDATDQSRIETRPGEDTGGDRGARKTY